MYFEMPNIQQEQHTLAWVDEGRQKVSFKCTQASCSIQFLNGNDVFAIQLLVLVKLFRLVIWVGIKRIPSLIRITFVLTQSDI